MVIYSTVLATPTVIGRSAVCSARLVLMAQIEAFGRRFRDPSPSRDVEDGIGRGQRQKYSRKDARSWRHKLGK